MNFFRKFLRMADIVLLLILMLQIFEMKEQMAASGASNMQDPKDAVFRVGKEFFEDVWENIFGEDADGNTASDKENPAGGSDEDDENIADESSRDGENEDMADEFAAVNFARDEELTVETAAAIESVREITVLLTNKGEGGYCHSTLSFSFTADVLLTEGESVTRLEAGDTLELDAADHAVGDTFSLEKAADISDTNSGEKSVDSSPGDSAENHVGVSAENTGGGESGDADEDSGVFRIDFTAESGSTDIRTYAGMLEITVTEDGFLLRNTLPLEEYLRYVVPAEMPASCPEEALKAQAICARTYALQTAAGGAFAEYGADISDDTSCQVYNTQGTDERTDAAVLATAGEYLLFNGEPAECYYFSTSCGVTTDASIWGEEISYLRSVPVSGIPAEEEDQDITEGAASSSGDLSTSASETETKPEEKENPESEEGSGNEEGSGTGEETEIGEFLKNEENLRSFLDDDTSGAEAEEAWYRWKAAFSPEILAARLESEIGDIQSIEVTERGSGGVAVELTVYGNSGQQVIESQYAIREFFRLCDGASCIRNDGTVISDPMLLPSAFFYIQTESDGTVTLVGGGFGHGCGMSQNAAKAYAGAGADAYEILSFFYSGTKIYREGT